jgi:hypothetical protein
MGRLSGLVGSEQLQAQALASFDSPVSGSNKPVTVRYRLANGANGGLSDNYELPAQVLSASILATAGSNPAQPLVFPVSSKSPPYLLSSAAYTATAVMVCKPELESRNECSALTPEDCDCQPSSMIGVDVCMVPAKGVRDRSDLRLDVTSAIN